MKLEIKTFTLGPLDNNSYLLWVEGRKHAVLIDPSYDIQTIIGEIKKQELILDDILITHAHFDHVIGVSLLLQSFKNRPRIGLHPSDLKLWRTDAGAKSFNLHISLPRDPDFYFSDSLVINSNGIKMEVRHVPGHTPGHVIFYAPQSSVAFCGDAIFYHSIGRTDLPGSDFQTLLTSIRSNILTLPSDTRLLCGHGEETTVAEEQRNNPFLFKSKER
jgi:hydroxyacylglutathione hydrolase